MLCQHQVLGSPGWLINRAIEGRKDQNTFATELGNWLSLSVLLLSSTIYHSLLCLMSCPFSIIAQLFSFFFFTPKKGLSTAVSTFEQCLVNRYTLSDFTRNIVTFKNVRAQRAGEHFSIVSLIFPNQTSNSGIESSKTKVRLKNLKNDSSILSRNPGQKWPYFG